MNGSIPADHSGLDRFDIIGKVPIAPLEPAAGNAILAVTGRRLLFAPFRKHDPSWN